MPNLQKWEDKIKAKRMKTPFREFVKEIASWYPIVLNKNNGIVSKYPSSERIKKVLSYDDFEDTRDNLVSKWVEFNDDLSFFENYKILFKSIDLPALIIYAGNENAWFSDIVLWSKNIYLGSAVIQACENILYSFNIKENSKNIFNSISVIDSCENVYLSSWVIKSSDIFYSRYLFNSNNIWFSRNLIGCHECIFCENLENQSYCINNQKFEKEEYFRRKMWILSRKDEFLSWYQKSATSGINVGSTNVKGDFIFYSENVENGHSVYQVKNGRNVLAWGWTKTNENIYDVFTGGSIWNQDIYAVTSAGANSESLFCCAHIPFSSHLYYSYFLESCSFCLGCIGLKNKSYCILNKQYTKEEWYELADKIFAQMDADGTLWDFFPWNLNPFYFNDTMAYLIDDTFTKEEVEKEWYLWRDEAIKVDIPEGADIIETKDLNQYQWYDTDGNWTIQEDILSKVIRDEKGNFYKIVPMELEFLQKHKLPLPEIHWLERIKMGFRM